MKKLANKAGQDKIDLQALKESEARFRGIVLWSPDAIIVTDTKGKTEYMNPAAEGVFNRKVESFIGKDFGLPLVDGESTEIDIFRPGKEPGLGDMYVVETEWLNKKAHLITIRDITERKLMEEKVMRAEKLALIGRITSSISHELRTPLSAISNAIYFLKMMEIQKQNPKVADNISLIDKEINECTRLIANMLDFAKPKTPKTKESRLDEIINESISLILMPSNVEIITKYQKDLPSIMVDPLQMQQVFNNMIKNALQAMANGGKLTVTTKNEGENAVVEFMDTGCGIPKEHLLQIFDPLFSTFPSGTGLGLSVCRQIIEAHDGTIEVKSEAGKGSVFKITLP